MVEADFTGSITYQIKVKKEVKPCLIRFCDSLSKALDLEILKDQTLIEFLKSLTFSLQCEDSHKYFTQTMAQHLLQLQNGFERYLKMKYCMTSLSQLQFRSILIFAEFHGGASAWKNGWNS